MANNVRSYNKYGENLARKKRRRFYLWISGSISAVLIAGVSVFYILFYSNMMQITDISITGLKTIEASQFYESINSNLNQNALGINSLKPNKNILFFDTDSMRNEFIEKFPILKSLTIKKEYFHKIALEFSERSAIGSWCRAESCYNFDDDGILWGKTAKSSGSLLLIIEDFRTTENNDKTINPELLNAIKSTYTELETINLKIKRIEIPADSIGYFKAYLTNDHQLLMSTENEIKNQIKTLEIFLSNQKSDFKPEYIDLRIDGRVYFK